MWVQFMGLRFKNQREFEFWLLQTKRIMTKEGKIVSFKRFQELEEEKKSQDEKRKQLNERIQQATMKKKTWWQKLLGG
jgi:hypothetical protein